MPPVSSSIIYFSASLPKSLTASFGSSEILVAAADDICTLASRWFETALGTKATAPPKVLRKSTVEQEILIMCICHRPKKKGE
mmetsp:Transcript_31576/g.57163  ORF Transcript_31576/g.57163 Transcript_31576/m.57163 type:complete len:83 (-) Transcript_31576:98-346(-)